MKARILFLAVLPVFVRLISANAAEYGVALTSTPVLNTRNIADVFGGTRGRDLKIDSCNQVRELEYIALPGALFKILKKQHVGNADIYEVETDEYKVPPNIRLYVDGRFLKLESAAPEPRKASLPPYEEIMLALRASVGMNYVWGGNAPNGVPELSEWFYKGIDDSDRKRLSLAGLDCSGLLYHATGGWTPRNTSQLVTYGRGVPIDGKRVDEIVVLLQPLDIVVWDGHVIIVLDRQTTIESRLECGKAGNGGVVISPLSRRMSEIMHSRKPANVWTGGRSSNIFVVRRWYDKNASEQRVESLTK